MGVYRDKDQRRCTPSDMGEARVAGWLEVVGDAASPGQDRVEEVTPRTAASCNSATPLPVGVIHVRMRIQPLCPHGASEQESRHTVRTGNGRECAARAD